MKLFLKYLCCKKKAVAVWLIFVILFVLSFGLYHLPLKAVLYPSALCAIIGIIYFVFDYRETLKIHYTLLCVAKISSEMIDGLPDANEFLSRDYEEIIKMLTYEQKIRDQKATQKYDSMIEYYTVWAHQIKTPIASMKLTLQNEDSVLSRKLLTDLSRIEQYADMVLAFLRLDSDSTDYVIKEYDLDSIIRSAIKKFSGDFICKKLSLDYKPVNTKVLTDEKWLSFVIEQVISNAIKYTNTGGVSIYIESPKTLCIRDSGIGIAQEDLPRIFDNGYTGFNGRKDKRASGIGLYLCRRVCDNLGHKISVESKLDCGTVIRIDMNTKKIGIE